MYAYMPLNQFVRLYHNNQRKHNVCLCVCPQCTNTCCSNFLSLPKTASTIREWFVDNFVLIVCATDFAANIFHMHGNVENALVMCDALVFFYASFLFLMKIHFKIFFWCFCVNFFFVKDWNNNKKIFFLFMKNRVFFCKFYLSSIFLKMENCAGKKIF